MNLRLSQRADYAPIRAIVAAERFQVESPAGAAGPDDRAEIVEHLGRIVAVSWTRFTSIAAPTFHPDPVPTRDHLLQTGAESALVGMGLYVAETLTRTELRRIHRLTRTLRAEEHGVKYTICRIRLPPHPVYDAAALAQQIAAGAIDFDPLTVALGDGYWPVAVTSDHTVWVVRRTPGS